VFKTLQTLYPIDQEIPFEFRQSIQQPLSQTDSRISNSGEKREKTLIDQVPADAYLHLPSIRQEGLASKTASIDQ
jgi:hypothetical protein